MKSISVFNRYLVPVLFIILLVSVLSGCHVLHHPRGHQYSRDNHHVQPAHQSQSSMKAKHRVNRH